jgi:hypothetical protein
MWKPRALAQEPLHTSVVHWELLEMNEYRVLSPDGTRKSKPCGYKSIETAFRNGNIAEGWLVQTIATGECAPVEDFVSSDELPETLIQIRPVQVIHRGQKRQRQRVWLLLGFTALACGAIMAIAVSQGRSGESADVADQASEPNLTPSATNGNADAEMIAAANRVADAERIEKTKGLQNATSWTKLQDSLRRVDGFAIMPTINAQVIGSVSVGDNMLSVAEKLSIRGEETMVLGETSQVAWKDESGSLVLTFENGVVTGKVGF